VRFDQLRLIAFGPFTDLAIDLSRCKTGLHVLYGDNAAGKSTTLRAVRGLLYGIPLDTPDAHRHRMTDLRIGATVRAADGSVLEVVRRKGKVSTLLDPSGAPIDEAPLRRLLAGVSEEMFANVFGLDHDALRRGGDAILSGGGDVAESLFEAGSGAGSLHALSEELRKEMDALWTPQAHKRPLAEAIARFVESRKAARADALSHETWAAQERALAETRAEHERVVAERREAELRRRWLERGRRVRPSLARRRQWLSERAAIGEVPPLSEGAVEERRQAQRDVEAARGAIERADAQLAETDRQLAALGSDGPPGAPEGTADALAERAARLRATLDELARRRGDHERLLEGLAQRAARLGEAAAAPPLDLAAQGALRDLASQRRAAAERASETDRRLEESARRGRTAERRRAALGDAVELVALERALARARQAGDLEARLASARAAAAQLEEAARAAAVSLAPWAGSPEDGVRLAKPALDTIERFEAEAEALAAAAGAADVERQRARGRAAAAEQGIAAIEREGRVPDAEDLGRARGAREESWTEVRARWAAGDAAAERRLGPAHERLVREADETGDLLRREAARVGRLAALRAEREAAQGEAEAAVAARAAVDDRMRDHEARWRAAWAVSGLSPGPPAEMRTWSERHDELVQLEVRRTDAARTVRELEVRVRAVAEDLATALGTVGEVADPAGPSLAVLVDAAAARVFAERERSSKAQAADEALAEARADHEALVAVRAEQEAVERRLAGEWARAVGRLGLPEDTPTEVALEVLEAARELWARRDEAASVAHSVEGTAAAARALADEVGDAVRAYAPDLVPLDPEAAVRRLVERLKASDERARARAALERQRAERAEEREEARAEMTQAAARLEALRLAAGAGSLAELEHVEQRWAAASALDRKLADAAAHLLDAGEGASVEELEATYAGLDADRLGAELAEIEARLPELEERANDLDFKARGIEAGRRLFPEELRVVHVAEDAQAHLARVRELAHRWVRLRLASVILTREIEQYRAKNQGPVLARASELFRRLTVPEFRGLRVGWSSSHKDRLECLGGDGAILEVGELSDGQRDALYLALRLASLERALETAEPVPLVLDDVLIHMDDHHVRAALEVLAEVATRTQVLFFTHNEHIVSIARAAFAEGTVCVHRLARAETPRSETAASDQ